MFDTSMWDTNNVTSSPFPNIGEIGNLYIETNDKQLFLWDADTDAYKKVSDGAFESRLTILEDNYGIKEIWESQSSTSGTLTQIYANTTINQDKWLEGVYNAYAVKIEAGRPKDELAVDSSGNIIFVNSLNASGDYVLSGTPSPTPFAIIWQVIGKAKDLALIPESVIVDEFEIETPVVRDGNGDIKPLTDGDNFNILSGGFKDTNVSTAILLGESGETSFSTTKKSIVGAVNENKANIDLKANDNEVVHLTGNESVGGEKDFTTGIKVNSSDLLSSVSTGVGDNDKLVTQGYVDDAVSVEDLWDRVTGATNYLKPKTDGDNLNLLSGGVQDDFVTTAIKKGDALNTSYNTTNKTDVGSLNELEQIRDLKKEPTGFLTPEDLILTGNGTNRTITLTGTVEGYYRGELVPELTVGYESPAHADDKDPYVLIYDGSSIQWIALANYSFSDLLIAFVFYAPIPGELIGDPPVSTHRVYARECHELMQWQAHENDHDTIGTYRDAGGDLADYVLASTTATNRRPSVSSTTIKDEDLRTVNPLLASDGVYTQFNLASTGLANFLTTPVDIVPLSTTRPFWNEFTGGAWQQTLISNNYYMSVWLMATPPTADAQSQAYRYLWVQGQNQNATLTGERGLTTNDVSLGNLTALNPEVIFFKRIIIRYQGGNWTFIEVEDITGTKANQTSSPQGSFLSVVTSDTTLTGDGTVSTPLGIDLSNPNAWTGLQTFNEVDVDQINIDGDTIKNSNAGSNLNFETTSDGNIIINPNGTGYISNVSHDTDNYFFLSKPVGSPATDQSQLIQNSFVTQTNAWQSFTTGVEGFLTSIDIRNLNAVNNVVLYIYVGEGTGGELLSQTTIGNIGSGVQTLTIENPPYLKTGTQYTWAITNDANNSIQFQNTNVYAGGRSSVNANYDFYFLTRIDEGFPIAYDHINGRFGIGISEPTEALDVVGDVKISGLTASQIVETDGSKVLVSVAKGTAYNKAFGVGSSDVCEGDDGRLSDSRTPTAHDLSGALHNSSTLANLNLKVSDATLIDTGDARLSDSRTCDNTFDDGDTALGNLGLDTNLKNLTSGEITQLENIGATTISADQWGYLGAFNQGLATTDDVEFDDLNLTGTLTAPNQCYFQAYTSSTPTNITGDGTVYTVLFNTENYDIGGDYNPATGIFTAPVDGKFYFSGGVRISGMVSTHTRFYIRLTTSKGSLFGVEVNPYVVRQTSSTNTCHFSVAVTMFLEAGDTAKIDIAVAGVSKAIDINGASISFNYFTGGLLC